jgi:hypothetical protein
VDKLTTDDLVLNLVDHTLNQPFFSAYAAKQD